MNMKKILAGVLSTAMLMSLTSAVMAEEEGIMLISANEEEIMPISVEDATYDKQILKGTVAEVAEGQILFTDGESEFAINTDENTVFIDENGEKCTIDDIKAEDIMMVVASNMQTRSLPPQSYGYLLAKADGDMVPTFVEVAAVAEDESKNTILTSADGNYEIVISAETEGVTAEDIKEGTQLLAYSNMMTMSIPAVVPASKAVILDANTIPEIEVDVETEEEAPAETAVTVLDKATVNGTELELEIKGDSESDELAGKILPVRAICEAMGLKVEWDGTLKAVTIGTTAMGVNFNIGVNKYNKARMAAQELSAAPVVIDDRTYLPAEFFTDILEAELTIVDGQININAPIAE